MEFVDEISAARKFTPLIVCGMARSGTRMITDLLNRFDEVAIQPEMHAATLDAYLEMTESISGTYSYYSEKKGRNLAKYWERFQPALAFCFLALGNKKGPVGRGKKISYLGIKTPSYEHKFDAFEQIFHHGQAPLYVYCMRRPKKVWASWKSLGYEQEVGVFSRRYRRSLKKALRISESCRGRFALFDLDSYLAAQEKRQWVIDHVLAPLVLSVEMPNDFIPDAVPNRNSLERAGKPRLLDRETRLELDALKSCPELVELRNRLARAANAPPRQV